MKPRRTLQHASALSAVGLTEHESSVYVHLVENGPQTVKTLTTRLPIPRTLVYHILRQLEVRGLVLAQKSMEEWRTTYAAVDPRHLYTLVRDEEKRFAEEKNAVHELVPALHALFVAHDAGPVVTNVRGVVAYAEKLGDILHAQPGRLYRYLDPDVELPGAEEREQFERRRRSRKITMYVMCKDSKKAREHIARRPYDDYTQFRVIPSAALPRWANLTVHDKGVFCETASPTHEPSAVYIENATLAGMQIDLFTTLWEQAEPITLAHIHV